MLEAYMGGLKEDCKHKLCLKHLENFMKAMQYAHHIQANNKATHKSTTGTYPRGVPLEHMKEVKIEFFLIGKPYLKLLDYHRRIG